MAFQVSLPTFRPALGTAKLAGAIMPKTAKLLLATSRFAPTTRRLVVLVPDADTNESELARQVWAMALTREVSVLLVGVFADAEREPRARRRLATLAALMRDDRVTVETRLEMSIKWINVIRNVVTEGDVVVCHAEQRVTRWGIRREPLSRLLMAQLQTPVCELTGFYPELPPEDPGPIAKALVVAIPLILIAGFTALQIILQRTIATSPSYTVLMSLSVVLEYGLIGLWYFLLN